MVFINRVSKPLKTVAKNVRLRMKVRARKLMFENIAKDRRREKERENLYARREQNKND